MEIKDMFAEEYERVLKMLKPFKKLKSGKYTQIKRIKGLTRFEDKIE